MLPANQYRVTYSATRLAIALSRLSLLSILIVEIVVVVVNLLVILPLLLYT